MNLRNFALLGVFILVMLGMYTMVGGGGAVGTAGGAAKPVTFTDVLDNGDLGQIDTIEI